VLAAMLACDRIKQRHGLTVAMLLRDTRSIDFAKFLRCRKETIV